MMKELAEKKDQTKILMMEFRDIERRKNPSRSRSSTDRHMGYVVRYEKHFDRVHYCYCSKLTGFTI